MTKPKAKAGSRKPKKGEKPKKAKVDPTIGRPSGYQASFAAQAAKLCKLGATDDDLAEGVSGEDAYLAVWMRLHRADASGVIAAQKKARSERKRERRRNSPSERIRNATAARIWAAIRGKSEGALFSRLGFSTERLKAHLELLFRDGMSWANYGTWHIDHIRPCASFDLTDPAQFAECWRLENLQPLWAADNIRKGARYGAA